MFRDIQCSSPQPPSMAAPYTAIVQSQAPKVGTDAVHPACSGFSSLCALTAHVCVRCCAVSSQDLTCTITTSLSVTPFMPTQPSPSHRYAWTTTNLLSISITSSFQDCYMNGLVLYNP